MLLFYKLTNVMMLFIDYRHQTLKLINFFQLTNLEILGSPFYYFFEYNFENSPKKVGCFAAGCPSPQQNLTCLQQIEAGAQTLSFCRSQTIFGLGDALSLMACVENIQYSDYFAGLEGPAKSRYQEKITVCGFDPYALRKSDLSENIELLPNVQYPDIVNYLVLQTSWATKTQMKAYKSMDAYNFFVSGWVNTARVSNVIFGGFTSVLKPVKFFFVLSLLCMFVLSIVSTSLFSLFYVTREGDRFLRLFCLIISERKKLK